MPFFLIDWLKGFLFAKYDNDGSFECLCQTSRRDPQQAKAKSKRVPSMVSDQCQDPQVKFSPRIEYIGSALAMDRRPEYYLVDPKQKSKKPKNVLKEAAIPLVTPAKALLVTLERRSVDLPARLQSSIMAGDFT